MENEPRNTEFSYTYSASQRAEVESIRKKYIPPEADKMEQLRLLDRKATRKGRIVSITLGVVSLLVLGVGMCCTMVWPARWFVPGIVIGWVGIAGVGAAYPLFKHITKKQRELLAPQVLKLTEELLK